MKKKKLYRSEENKVIAGIVGGLGDYFEVDPALLRLIAVVVLILSGVFPAAIVYIVAMFIIPRRVSSEEDVEYTPTI